MKFEHKKCICGTENDTVLYPERIDWSILSAYDFSARRDRKIQHYRIVRCNNCGLVRSNPVFSEEDIIFLYKDCKFLDEEISCFAAKTYSSLLSGYLSRLKDRRNIHLLEVGCGNGALLREARSLNVKNVVGIEPSKDAYNYAAEEIKHTIINDIFRKNYFSPETFDIVCSFHVLDHLFNPDEFLKEIYRIVKKDGLILFACHDVDAIVNKIFGEHSPVFDIEHIFLFNKTTLRRVVEGNRFNVIDIGNLRNTYQISYWLKYVPVFKRLVPFLPGVIRNQTLTFLAGNIFVCAEKR